MDRQTCRQAVSQHISLLCEQRLYEDRHQAKTTLAIGGPRQDESRAHRFAECVCQQVDICSVWRLCSLEQRKRYIEWMRRTSKHMSISATQHSQKRSQKPQGIDVRHWIDPELHKLPFCDGRHFDTGAAPHLLKRLHSLLDEPSIADTASEASFSSDDETSDSAEKHVVSSAETCPRACAVWNALGELLEGEYRFRQQYRMLGQLLWSGNFAMQQHFQPRHNHTRPNIVSNNCS